MRAEPRRVAAPNGPRRHPSRPAHTKNLNAWQSLVLRGHLRMTALFQHTLQGCEFLVGCAKRAFFTRVCARRSGYRVRTSPGARARLLCAPLYEDCQEETPIGPQAPRAARTDQTDDHGPISIIPFPLVVSLFDLEPFLRPDPRVSRMRRAQLRSRLAVAVSSPQTPLLTGHALTAASTAQE